MTELTKKQQFALDCMTHGKNIFLTGPPGTGKSFIIRMFKDIHINTKTIAVTSTTGISSLLIGGTTLHSYLGIGLGLDTAETLVSKIIRRPYFRTRWQKLDVLIIDEISMLSPQLFDKLEQVARQVRIRKSLLSVSKVSPFGGIQLILSGDFLQLPVVKCEKFCFEADTWEKCIDITIELDEIIRQPDQQFQHILNDIRYGYVTERVKNLLTNCANQNLDNINGIKPTVIHTTNALVDLINEKELDNLNTDDRQFYEYDMNVYIYKNIRNAELYKKNCSAPDTISLCKDAQVMLLCNLDLHNGLANGSRGIITGFIEDFPIVKFLNGEERLINIHNWDYERDEEKILRITQIPLRLAWAITVHRSQGSTIDYAEIDLGNIFEYGQAYVALSRVRTKEGLKILNIDFDSIRAHPRAIEFYQKNLSEYK